MSEVLKPHSVHDQMNEQNAANFQRLKDENARLVEQLEAAKEDRDRCGRMLLDVEGSILAYWTDIPDAECERLRVTIRHVLDTLPSLDADLAAASTPAKERP